MGTGAYVVGVVVRAAVLLPDRPGTVLLDLSQVLHLDHPTLSSLHRTVVGLRARGWQVGRADPGGPSLRLLDDAARASWAPPVLTCTDVLHWRPRCSAALAPVAGCGCP